MKEALHISLILLVAAVLLLYGALRMSCTSDEVAHVPAGYSYLVTGDFRMNVEHPPLAKILAALPLLPLQPSLDQDDYSWKVGEEWPFGQKFLFVWNDPDRLLIWARLPILLLTLLLGLLVYAWGRELAGHTTGLLAALLLLTTPEILAHGALVTTDMALTCFMLASVYAFYRCLVSRTRLNLLFFAVPFALCQVSKFSAPLLVPVLGAVALWYLVRPQPLLPVPIATGHRQRLRRLLLLAGVALPAAWLTIWASYGFRYGLSPDPEIAKLVDWERFAPQEMVSRLLRTMGAMKLLPEAYTFGLLDCLYSLQARTGYLLGRLSNSGWWYYYPVSFVLKTPLPLLLLFGWSLAALARRWREQPRNLVLLLPLLVYLLVAMTSKTNIGNRHILPIYPFVALLAAQVAAAGWSWRSARTRLVLALLFWQVAATVWIAPHYLAYFNELVGGPKNGYKYLVDSSLDWGQDLKRLAEYRDRHADETFFVSYAGAAAPTRYLRDVYYLPGLIPVAGGVRVDYRLVPSGSLVAISATNLVGAGRTDSPGEGEFLATLNRLEPVARIGYSIFVYRMP